MSRVFFLTANVGSVFENIDAGLSIWMNELIQKICFDSPDFVAIHFQETGGKNYKNGSKVIHSFFNVLVENFAVSGYDLLEGIVDSDSAIPDQFTALSCVHFIRKNCKTVVEVWNFATKCFDPLNPPGSPGKLYIGKEITSANWNQKEKFPQHFFPNCKWSRKGFARTRWRLGGIAFDLVNIHLFHDSHNLIAASTFPSPFSQNRQRALNFLLDKFSNDDLEKVPLFIFGDLNFRLNTYDIFEMLRKEAAAVENGPAIEDEQKRPDVSKELIIEAKRFSVSNHEQRFKEDWKWLRAYDYELNHFDLLTELDVLFHPTYPFDESDPGKFMKTRCPSWCDRVLFTPESKKIISNEPSPEYNLIGSGVCMGDHKPVYLKFNLRSCESSGRDSQATPVSTIYPYEETASEAGIVSVDGRADLGSKCRLVTFLRENLSFHQDPSPVIVQKDVSLAPSTPASEAECPTTDRKCYFLKIRSSTSGESQGRSNGIRERGKQNLLLSSEANGLESDNILSNKSKIPFSGNNFINGSSRTSRKENRDSKLSTSGCCPGCHVL